MNKLDYTQKQMVQVIIHEQRINAFLLLEKFFDKGKIYVSHRYMKDVIELYDYCSNSNNSTYDEFLNMLISLNNFIDNLHKNGLLDIHASSNYYSGTLFLNEPNCNNSVMIDIETSKLILKLRGLELKSNAELREFQQKNYKSKESRRHNSNIALRIIAIILTIILFLIANYYFRK